MLQDTIFVFGSNKAGRHGKGAALHAIKHCGAKYNQGEGLQGRAYAIPTKDGKLNVLSFPEVKGGVDRFLSFASTSDLQFQVTRVGCGLAALKDEQIFPLFKSAPANCLLPGIWEAKRTGVQRLLIHGSKSFNNYDLLYEEADRAISEWNLRSTEVEIVYPQAPGMPDLIKRYAQERGLRTQPFKAEWNRLGRNAGVLCNMNMAWYATHALVIWDGVSQEAQNAHALARENRLRTNLVQFTPVPKAVARVARKGIDAVALESAPQG